MEQPYVRCHESVTVVVLTGFLRERILSVTRDDLTVGHYIHSGCLQVPACTLRASDMCMTIRHVRNEAC